MLEHDKIELINDAIIQYSIICPLYKNKSLSADDHFTVIECDNQKKMIFWFNTEDNSTHVTIKILN